MSDKTHMHDNGESYSVVVPAKQPNKSGQPPAEAVEGRTLTKENVGQSNPRWTPSQTSGLDRDQSGSGKVAGEGRKEEAGSQKSKDDEGGSVRLAKNPYIIVRGYWKPASTRRM
jgi:hypothetical protein